MKISVVLLVLTFLLGFFSSKKKNMFTFSFSKRHFLLQSVLKLVELVLIIEMLLFNEIVNKQQRKIHRDTTVVMILERNIEKQIDQKSKIDEVNR